MVEQAHQYRLGHSNLDSTGETSADHGVVPYGLPKTARGDAFPEETVPLFLADYNGEPDPSEYANPLRKRTASISARVLAGVLGAAALAVLFALFTSDATQDIVGNFKASIAAVLPAPSAAAQSDPSQLTQRDRQLNAAQQPSAPGNQTVGVRTVTIAAVAPPAAATPTREEIKSAYQSALQNGTPLAAIVPDRSAMQGGAPPTAAAPDRTTPQVGARPTPPVAEPTIAADPIHQLDPNEIASLLRRGDALIASGDLAAARLVMRRAADAGDARAAMTLAETYDPAILEKRGVYGFVPDIALARRWYEKAKKFGANEATQRLELLASKQH
ncbi:MAG TPA: hypothetical protein VKB08_22510 [Bradyrhizobium sp.]|nr:hypothetical protein [Bradyrhizobium sp.]